VNDDGSDSSGLKPGVDDLLPAAQDAGLSGIPREPMEQV
jgi:hypothetical protein